MNVSKEELLYELFVRLDRLEELHEDWLAAQQGRHTPAAIDETLRAELRAAGVTTGEDIERLMAELQREVDALDTGAGTT